MTATVKQLIPNSVKKSIKELWNSNAGHSLRFFVNHRIRGKSPILVVQMGKVGSRSIAATLDKYGEWVYHAHSIDPSTIKPAIEKNGPKHSKGLKHWLWIYHRLIEPQKVAPIRIITLVRDPMAQNVASFFENLPRYSGISQPYDKFTLDELLDMFYSKFNSPIYPLEWFDRGFNKTPGIDVYAYPFDKAKGYSIIKEGRYELLIIKTETDDSIKAKALEELLGLSSVTLSNTNIGEAKTYADLYKAFKQQIALPREEVEYSCASKFVQHFYTEEEIARMKARWLRQEA